MSEPEIISNYTRPESRSSRSSKWWYLIPAVVLPLCMGSFITGQDVWLSPATALKLVQEFPSQYQRDVLQAISVIVSVACGIVISTKRKADIFRALGMYLAGFLFWGTAYLVSFGQLNFNVMGGFELIYLTAAFGLGTLVVVVGPAVLVLWMFVWMFRTARGKMQQVSVDPIKHATSMEAITELRKRALSEPRDTQSVGVTHNSQH